MKRDKKEGEISIQNRKERICHVCEEEIHEMNLPDAQCVVDEENLYDARGVRIIDTEVVFLISCEHQYEDIGVSVDDPHKIAILAKGRFDGHGKGVQFEITDIRPGG